MDIKPRIIDVLLFDGVNLLDVAGPVQAFGAAVIAGKAAYQLGFVAVAGQALTVRSSCGLSLQATESACLRSAATDLLIPGGAGVDNQIGNKALRELIGQWHYQRPDARLVSVCSGALLLADAGVLDGLSATTHWSRDADVRHRFRTVDWQLDRIMIAHNGIFTSAGVTTGIDLALSLIRNDCGTPTALAAARELVVYLTRSGGQNQYGQIIEWQLNDDDRLATLVNKIVEYPNRDWTLPLMASTIDMTPRTLSRRFTVAFDTSPVRFVERLRVRLAGDMLSAGVPVERVATRSGFGDVQTLRRAFKRQLGTTLGEYVERFAV